MVYILVYQEASSSGVRNRRTLFNNIYSFFMVEIRVMNGHGVFGAKFSASLQAFYKFFSAPSPRV